MDSDSDSEEDDEQSFYLKKIKKESAVYEELLNDRIKPKFLGRVIERIINFNDWANLEKLKFWIKVFTKIREFLTERTVTEAAEATETILPKILALTDEQLKNVKRKTITEIMNQHGALLRMIHKEEAVYAQLDNFDLDVCLKFFTSPYLEKRLLGLNDLRSHIETVFKKEVLSSHSSSHSMHYNMMNSNMNTWKAKLEKCTLTRENLLEWFNKKQILEKIYVHNIHPEVIKRATDIPKFYCKCEKFTRQHVDLMWSATIGRHESVLQAVFSSLIDLADELPLDCVDYLYSKIISTPTQNIDAQAWNLLSKVSCKGINVRSNQEALEKKYYLLEFCWDLLQDEYLDHGVYFHANHWFVSFLQWDNVPAEVKQEYLGKAIENIRNHKVVLTSLSTIEKVVESVYNFKGNNAHVSGLKSTLMQNVEEKEKLLDLVIEDVLFYKQQVANIIKDKQLGNITDSNYYFVGRSSHYHQIKNRLDFLKFCLLVSGPIVITNAQIDILWNALVVEPIMYSDSDIAFAWLEELLNEFSHSSPFTMESVLYIFDAKFPNLDASTLSTGGYNCFNHFFKFVNWKKNTLHWGQTSYSIQPANDFVGVSTLWRIALESRNEEVGRLSIALLNDLVTRVSNTLRLQLPLIRKTYIQVCMHYLIDAYSHDPNLHKNRLRIQRCLRVLTTLLESSLSVRNAHGGRKGVLWHLNLMLIGSGNNKHTLEVYSNDTLNQLYQKIHEKTGIALNEFRVVTAGKELKGEENGNVTLKESKIDNGHALHVICKPAGGHSSSSSSLGSQRANAAQRNNETGNSGGAANSEDDSGLPGELLNQQIYLDQLFSLLELDSETAQMSWGVLMMIPTNGKYLQDIKTFGANWKVLLDSGSSFKLLYMLQIIDRFIQLEDTDDQLMSSGDRDQWRNKFFSTGGVSRLTDILLHNDIKIQAGGKGKAALANVLRVVNFFLVGLDKDKGLAYLMKERFESLVQQKLDVTLLMDQILKINISCAGQEVEDTDYEVVDRSLLLLEALCISNPESMNMLATSVHLQPWLSAVILQCPNHQIRKRAVALVSKLCRFAQGLHLNNVQTVFLQHMLSIFQTAGSQISTAEQFFEILNELVGTSISNDATKGQNNEGFVNLLERVSKLLKDHTMIEKRNNESTDYVLIGILNLLRTLLNRLPDQKYNIGQKEGLLKQVFSTCLFDTPTVESHGVDAPPLCKRDNTRKAAFQLLNELIKGCNENFSVVIDHLIEQNKGTGKSKAVNPPISALDKSKSGYVGLENLGATCYMNSLIQQLYMVPQFRQGLLQAPDKESDKNESMLYQLQIILSNLQESEKKFYDTTPFCKTYKDFEGKPMKVNEQQDVEEFFNMLFDRLETSLKGSEQEKLMANFFGGQTSNQFISKSCPHVSERVEQFFTLGLDVKGKKDIKESLEAFVQGDMLDGSNQYHCGTCDAKVDALKRTCIKTLPDNLILHLKRFEFDLEAMKRIKINDYVYFPMTLDMEPYTKEGLAKKEGTAANDESLPQNEKSYYMFELAGVLVHKGTADYGHYYSYIRERQALANGVKPEWLCFNDTMVETFEITELEKECFGGSESVSSWDGMQNKHVTRSYNKQYNAYMLFYQRVKAERPEPILSVPEAAKKVPSNIFHDIWRENLDLFRDERMLDPEYFNFVWESVQLEGGKPVSANVAYDFEHPTMKVIRLFIYFIIYTASRSKEKSSMSYDFVEVLNQKFTKYVPACRWFLELLLQDDGAIVKELLLQNNSETTRTSFAKVICHVLHLYAPLERPVYPRALASSSSSFLLLLLLPTKVPIVLQWKKIQQPKLELLHLLHKKEEIKRGTIKTNNNNNNKERRNQL